MSGMDVQPAGVPQPCQMCCGRRRHAMTVHIPVHAQVAQKSVALGGGHALPQRRRRYTRRVHGVEPVATASLQIAGQRTKGAQQAPGPVPRGSRAGAGQMPRHGGGRAQLVSR